MSSVDWVLLARLVRPQGRKGEIISEIFTDFPDRFKDRPRVFLRTAKSSAPPREALIEKHWMHQGRVVLKLKGVDSMNDAELLRGVEVVVPPEERVPLTDDSVYVGDLIGCRLVDVAGVSDNDIGEVTDVERQPGGAPDLLVLRPSHKGAQLLIPFAKSYLVAVDIAARRIIMRLPEGLVDLNATAGDDPA